jgi:two-component system cell cycle response regulator DivK
MGGASGWAGGIDGESAGRTTVLGAGWYPASSGFAETAQAGLLRTENYFPVVFGSRRDDPTLILAAPTALIRAAGAHHWALFNMTRSHRTKRNDGKPSRGRNGAALDGRSARSKTVMIVEDNELNMKLFHDLLEAYGYHPIGTRNGIEALDLARKHRPDLILMDIMLPEVSGLDVTKWLKEDAELKAIPVVAVTAFAMKGDEERIREAGCEAYLSKPIQVAQFIETIQRFSGPASACF